jgi:hypothetical protein
VEDLLPYERDELRDLLNAFHEARSVKDYAKADKVRESIKLWDTSLKILTTDDWVPLFEDNTHRIKRLQVRVMVTNKAVYPFNRGKKGHALSAIECFHEISAFLRKAA